MKTADDVMIGGFILGGNGSTVLLRALGPSLSLAGVPGTLSDPTLELHDSNGSVVAINDNWRDTQEASIEAVGLPPTDALESAIWATFPAGAYTAIVAGKNGTTGVALVEVYAVQ